MSAHLREVNGGLQNAAHGQAGGEYANLRYADLSGADLRYADLRYADLRYAVLYGADLSGADLSGITVSWNAHALLSEILFRASSTFLGHQALAALIARHTDWCWAVWTNDEAPEGIEGIEWENIVVAHREWALSELAKWVKDGDKAPEVVRQYAQREVPA